MSHMYGSAPFPLPRLCGGGDILTAQLSPPHVDLDSPKDVLTECVIFCIVVKVQRIGSLGTSDVWRDNEAIL